MTEEDAGGGNLQSAVGAGGPTFVKIVVDGRAVAIATEKNEHTAEQAKGECIGLRKLNSGSGTIKTTSSSSSSSSSSGKSSK